MFGAEGEIRTLEASLEDSHVSSYITPAKSLWSAAAESRPLGGIDAALDELNNVPWRSVGRRRFDEFGRALAP